MNSQLQEIVLSAREMSISPPQVVSELVNSPRAVRCAFSHFSAACRRFYCYSGCHFASSQRKSTPAPSWYFVYGLAPFRRHVTYYATFVYWQEMHSRYKRQHIPIVHKWATSHQLSATCCERGVWELATWGYTSRSTRRWGSSWE